MVRSRTTEVLLFGVTAGWSPSSVSGRASVVPKIRQWAGQASQEMWFASTSKTYGQKLRWATTAPSKGTCTPAVTRVVIPAASSQTAAAVWPKRWDRWASTWVSVCRS